jgi:small nuclear ribonucleoprotein (snRNP)-like protein
LSSVVFRRFGEEMVSIVGKRVEIETSEGRKYQGNLRGIDERLDIILDDVFGAGENVFKVVINGNFVKEIRLVEQPFNLKALSERLNRVFPGLIKVREDIAAIIVMDKIKVTEHGVVEGGGLAADRVRAVYNEFIKEK